MKPAELCLNSSRSYGHENDAHIRYVNCLILEMIYFDRMTGSINIIRHDTLHLEKLHVYAVLIIQIYMYILGTGQRTEHPDNAFGAS